MNPKAILLLNGSLTEPEVFQYFYKAGWDRVICCDGGFRHTASYNIKSELVVGDLDSVDPAVYTAGVTVKKVETQDNSDLEKALIECVNLGIKSVVLLCGSGGRWGHIISMFHSMLEFCDKMKISAVLDESIISVHQNSITSPAVSGEVLSFFSLNNALCEDSQNLQYPLTNLTLQAGKMISLSNTCVSDSFSVTIKEGTFFMVRDIKKVMEYDFISLI